LIDDEVVALEPKRQTEACVLLEGWNASPFHADHIRTQYGSIVDIDPYCLHIARADSRLLQQVDMPPAAIDHPAGLFSSMRLDKQPFDAWSAALPC
jgi:hypothetical protein